MDTQVYVVSVFDSLVDCTDVLGVYTSLELAILNVCANAEFEGCHGVNQVEPQDAIGMVYTMVARDSDNDAILFYRIERHVLDASCVAL